MRIITAKHRIITDECRERGTDAVIKEVVKDVDETLRAALRGWPAHVGTEFHVKVEIVRPSVIMEESS